MNQSMTSPEIVVCDQPNEAAERVAEIFASAIESNPRIVLGLATGGTPVEVYRKLVQRHRQHGLDFTQVTSFNLDEYVGLGADHPESYRYFMQQHLFDHVNIPSEQTHVPNGCAEDLDQQAAAYDANVKSAGGIDLQLLGIGSNGHIAFNEPGSSIESRTRVVQLTDETVEANARFFDSIDQVPRSAITMGIGTILESRKIVLMATGEGKASAVAEAIEGPIDPSNPASALKKHSEVVFVLDRPAASRLSV